MKVAVAIIMILLCAHQAGASTGACCMPDGTCIIETPVGCDTRQGTYQGEGTTCTPNPCPQLGACCLTGGGCVTTTSADCIVRDGTYLGDGVSCTACSGVTGGACCLLDGHCLVMSESACYARGGSYRGDGTICDGTCPTTTGACCFGDGTCVVKTQGICEDQQGAYQGDGTTCSPNPCDQPGTGACCLGAAGDCVIKTAYVCASLGGTYMGDNTPCVAPNPCLAIPPPYQFDGHRFGVFTAISDEDAMPYVLQLVDSPDSLWWAKQTLDEHGWKPIKGASGVQRCLDVGLPGYSQCYLCGDDHCDDVLTYDLCCYYFASPPLPRSTLPPMASINSMSRLLIGGYDDIAPDICTMKTLRGHWPQPVSRMDSIKAYAAWMFAQYPDIREWQVGNEVDAPMYWGSPPNLYLDLVDTLRTQLESVCPDCRISVSFQLPGLGATYNPTGTSWWNQIGRRPNSFDIVDVHYNIMRFPSDTLLVRWFRTCPGKEMISLETGITDSLYNGRMPDVGGTRTKQARDLPRLLTMLFAAGYHRLSFNLYDNNNGGKDSQFFLHASLVNEDGVVKPSFWAYRFMIQMVDRFIRCDKLCTGQYRYTFKDGRRPVYVCWSGRTCPMDLLNTEDSSARVQMWDYMGNVVNYTDNRGTHTTWPAKEVKITEGETVYLRRAR